MSEKRTYRAGQVAHLLLLVGVVAAFSRGYVDDLTLMTGLAIIPMHLLLLRIMFDMEQYDSETGGQR